MSILEDDVVDSRDRVRCLHLTVGTLLKTTHLPEENWQPLANQTVLAAAKMFKKPDQVRSLVTVAALYWHGQTLETNGEKMKNGKKVVDILRKAAKIARECLEPLVQQQLFIQLLSAYTYYYEDNCSEVSINIQLLNFWKLINNYRLMSITLKSLSHELRIMRCSLMYQPKPIVLKSSLVKRLGDFSLRNLTWQLLRRQQFVQNLNFRNLRLKMRDSRQKLIYAYISFPLSSLSHFQM